MALTAARANKSTAVGFNLKRLRFGGRYSPDRDEQAKGDAERLFVLAAQIVGGFSKDGNEWGNLHARPPSSLVFRGLMLHQ